MTLVEWMNNNLAFGLRDVNVQSEVVKSPIVAANYAHYVLGRADGFVFALMQLEAALIKGEITELGKLNNRG